MSVTFPDRPPVRRPVLPVLPPGPPRITLPVEPPIEGTPDPEEPPVDPPPDDPRPPKPDPVEGYDFFWDGTKWVMYQVGESADERRRREEREAEQARGRQSAREYMLETFRLFGFNQDDLTQLGALLDQWIMNEGLADIHLANGDEIILNRFRQTDIYNRRFGGMAELRSRGQAISEAEYIQLEKSYRNVMSNYGLPATYYDSPEDYARLIGAGLSVNEVEERVVAARQTLNPLVAQELQEYYGVGQGDAMAFLLGLTDEKGIRLASARNQQQIREMGRTSQIGAAAERSGFTMDRAYAERLAGTSVGQTLDPFQMGTLAQLEGTFGQARRVADRETTLAGIDSEAFDQRDAVAAAFGDQQKTLASERRAKRERARFSGSSGASSASLGVQRNL